MEKNVSNSQLNDKQIHEIQEFVVRKREQILWILWNENELPQGELAKKADSTTTSLSNILFKFEQFKYKLLNCESRGVRKYYSLSDIGMSYMQYLSDKGKEKANNIISTSGACLLQEARNCIKHFFDKTDGDGEILIEDALLCLNYDIDNESTDEDVEVFLKYIYCIEKLIIMENEVYFEKAIQLIQSDILRKRIDCFLEGFYLFLPFLQILEDKKNILDIYGILENIAKEKIYEAAAVVNEKEWDIPYEKIEKLKNFFKKIMQSGRRKEDIYRMLYGCLPDKAELAAMITQIIYVDE